MQVLFVNENIGRVGQVADVKSSWGPAICNWHLWKREVQATENNREWWHYSQTIATFIFHAT